MKITVFFTLFLLLQATAETKAQKITISAHDATLREVMSKMQRQQGLSFFFLGDQIATIRIDVEVNEVSLGDAMAAILAKKNLEWYIVDRTIIIRRSDDKQPRELDPGPVHAAQWREVTGRITDNQGDALEGVTVRVKDAGTVSTTDVDGRYTIRVDEESSALLYSIVGYEPTELPISGRSVIDVSMEAAIGDLDEVVVVAYGAQRKLSVTGSVSSVGNKELRQSSSASLAVALAGRLPGLTSLQSGGGQPGRDDAMMFLRGAATTNGQQPLILIDGVPRDNIRTLDATEVESVTVLKDASATAVFGVRGANGVILINTRRGREGKMELNASLDQSWTSFTREPERLHSLEYMALRNEAAGNDGISALPFSQETMDRYANPLAGLDPADPDYERKARVREYMYPDHDYYRMFISKYTPQTRVNVSATGGSGKVNYFVNAGLLKQGGNLNTEPKSVLGYDPSAWMERYNFRANLDYEVSSSFKSFLNIGSYIETVNMPSAGGRYGGGNTDWMINDFMYQAQTVLPITPGPVTIDGFGVAPGQVVDPGYMDISAFEIMNRTGYRNEMRSNLNASLGMDWSLDKLTEGLSLRGMISYDAKATSAMQGHKTERLFLVHVNPETDEMSYTVKRPDEQLLSLAKGVDSRYNINMQASLNYARTFDKHAVSGMILAQRDHWESVAGEIPFNIIGVAGRFTYAYDDRYLAEINMGYNGSEQFAPSNRYGFFPAVSAGWVISNEAFLENHSLVTNLKMRASYGKVGNDQMGGARFLYQSDITMGGGPLGSLGRGQGIHQGLLGNPNLTWEVAEKQNYGLDIGIWGELDLAVDYFIEDRSEILITRRSVPTIQGVPLGNIPKVNMGIVQNKGFELELTYRKSISQEVDMTFRGNYGRNKNVVKFFDEPIRDEDYVHRYRTTGYPIGQQWGYKIDYSNGNGMFNTEAELADYLDRTEYGFGEPRLGDFKYVDFNNDGVVDDKDAVPLGYSSIPGAVYGISVSGGYRGFDLSLFFQGVSRYSTHIGTPQGIYEYIYEGTYFGYHKNAWTPERFANGDKITYPALSTHITTNHVANDFFIFDRSFLRLRNVELAYTLPSDLLKALRISMFRVYIGGQNLFVWDNLPLDHLDPESTNPIGYPVTKMFNLGLNVTF